MPISRIIGIALGTIVSLNLQFGVVWAATDQSPVTAPYSSISARTSPTALATEGASMLKGSGTPSNLTMNRHTPVATYQVTRSAPQEDDPVIWQHPIPTVGALLLRYLEDQPVGHPPTPIIHQVLNDEDLAIVAEVQLRF